MIASQMFGCRRHPNPLEWYSKPTLRDVSEEAEENVKAEDLINVSENVLVRFFWKGLGLFFVGLGTIGIYVPGLPTTSFMVLAAACFAKSDPRLYMWLLNNPLFGHYIRDFVEGKGIPFVSKVFIVGLMWTAIIISVWVITRLGDPGFGQATVVLVGLMGTWYVGWRVPTAK